MNKVGLIIGTLPAKYIGIAAGGIATHIEGLIDSLHKKGIQTYICYHKPFGIKHPEVINSSRIGWALAVLKGLIMLLFIQEHHWKKYTFKTNILLAYYYATLRCFFKQETPDFIHIHSLYNPVSIALKLLKYNNNIIVTDHGFWVDTNNLTNNMTIHLLKESFDVATKIIYISDFALIQHQKMQLGNLDKLVKISNPSFFYRYPCKQNTKTKNQKYRLIFNGYGKSMTIKGLPFLLDAVNNNEYLSRNLELLIICNDEAHNYLRQRIWNFEYKVFGRTKFKDILDMYVQSDILVVPSKFESFGLVYTEALAVGVPVIGYHEMIKEFRKTLATYIGESINIMQEQPTDLAHKIIKCLETPFNRMEVRNALLKSYDWDILIDRFLSLYYDSKSVE